jgi:hypothetical protein
VTKQVSAAGNIRFTAERTPDGHADRFWALGLAIHAATGSEGARWRPLFGTPGGGNSPDSDWIPA